MRSSIEIIELLKTIKFINAFSETKIKELAKRVEIVPFEKGEIIFEEKEKGNFFYIIKDGEVELRKHLEIDKNREFELGILSAPSYFGEMALLDQNTRSATIKAKTNVELVKICKNDFLDLSKNSPKALLELSKTMSNRIRNTNNNYMRIWEELLKRKRLAAIGNTTSKLVHDLKTPMSVIVLNAQSITRNFPAAEKYAGKMIEQTKEMEVMVREILDFAKGEEINLEYSKVNITNFFKSIKESYSSYFQLYPLDLKIINLVGDITISFDRFRVKRVVQNIIKNAFEAIHYEGKVEVTINQDDEFLIFTIIDSGEGLPEDIVHKIFDPFVTKNKSNGTGLGLAISQKIINDHKGEITASNTKDRGAKFEIKLPR